MLLLTFTYAATFIPGLFLPYQPGAIDLSSVAYRTSAILAEDPGWYSRVSANGTAWEDNTDDLSRLGLADDKDHPNVISIKKVNKLKEMITADPTKYNKFRHSMGLDGSVVYDFNIVVDMYNTLTGQHEELVNIQSPNSGSSNVESIERGVMIDTGEVLSIDCNIPAEQTNPKNKILLVNVSNATLKENLDILIYNFSTTFPISFINVTANFNNSTGMPLTIIDDYTITKNGVTMNDPEFTFTQGDILVVTIYKSVFLNYPNTQLICIGADSTAFPGREVYYKDDPVFKLKNVYSPGTMKLEVWSRAFV